MLREGRAGTDVAMAIARRLARLDLRDASATCSRDLEQIREEVQRPLAFAGNLCLRRSFSCRVEALKGVCLEARACFQVRMVDPE